MPPTFPKLPQPVTPAEAFVAPATFDAARGRAAVQHAVKDGLFKPSDIDAVELADPALLYVPFWRVSVSVDGFHVGLSSEGRSGRGIPMPTGGARHRDAVVMVCARTLVPYEPRLSAVFNFGTPALLEIGTNELVHANAVAAREALAAGEVVDADVDKARAEAIASAMLLRAVSPSDAIYAKYEPQVLSSTFCLYPMYYARYSYNGESRRHAGEELFVAVSGRTGEIVAEKHPSAVRAMANKLRKLLSFDRR